MKSERLGAITDGIIAIAATIMVLELKVPENVSLSSMVSQWPVFLAHFNSFFLIYLLWYNHYLELRQYEYLSVRIVLLNGLWLSFIALVPFSTGWMSNYPNGFAAQAVYLFNLTACYFFYQLILFTLAREKSDVKFIKGSILRTRIPIYLLLLGGFAVCFIRPYWALFFVLAIVFYNVFLLVHYLGHEKSR